MTYIILMNIYSKFSYLFLVFLSKNKEKEVIATKLFLQLSISLYRLSADIV